MGQPTEEERNRLPSQTLPAEGPEPELELDTKAPDTLLGSDVQPASFLNLEGRQVSLGEVVAEAFTASGVLDSDTWNALPSEKREEFIQAVVFSSELTPVEVEVAEEGPSEDPAGDWTYEAPVLTTNSEDPKPEKSSKKRGFVGRFGSNGTQ